jgi:predicted enzyme related to lactoylglutathione lyase
MANISDRVANKSTVVWFEIPSADFDRAAKFYETIFGTQLKREGMVGMKLGVFPYDQGNAISGAVIHSDRQKPGATGTVVYLNCNGRLEEVAGRVKAAGGKVLSPRVDLPDAMGSFYMVEDTEGNVVGLHAA